MNRMKKYAVTVHEGYVMHAVDGCSRLETPNHDSWELASGIETLDEACEIASKYVSENPSTFHGPGRYGIGSIEFAYVECYAYDDSKDDWEYEYLEDFTESTVTEEHSEAFDKALASYRSWCDYESDHYYTIEAFLEDEEEKS